MAPPKGKRVLDVGNCDMDHGSIASVLDSLDVEHLRAHGVADAEEFLSRGNVDLVLVNRVFDRDGASGLEFIRRLCEGRQEGGPAVMLISNFEDAQEQALASGAAPGFGKSRLNDKETLARIRSALGE